MNGIPDNTAIEVHGVRWRYSGGRWWLSILEPDCDGEVSLTSRKVIESLAIKEGAEAVLTDPDR